MEMNIEEIYVLNRALDGKDIFGLPAFHNMGSSNMLIKSVKNQLIRKGLLENESAFTMEGVQLVKLMDDYKKSCKYVKIGSILIGIKNEKTATVLLRKGIPVEYEFNILNLSDCHSHLSDYYPFLIPNKKAKTDETRSEIDYEDLVEAYSLTAVNALYISTYTVEDKKTTDEILFSTSEGVGLYDRKTQILVDNFCCTEDLIRERIA